MEKANKVMFESSKGGGDLGLGCVGLGLYDGKYGSSLRVKFNDLKN